MSNDNRKDGPLDFTISIPGLDSIDWKKFERDVRVMIAVIVLGAVVSFAALLMLPKLQTASRSIIPILWMRVLTGAIATLIVGFVLYIFRLSQRNLYGCVEIGFGAATAAVATFRLTGYDDASAWLAVVAASYIIVRGFDNAFYGTDSWLDSKSQPTR